MTAVDLTLRHIQQQTGWETHVVEYPSRAYTIKVVAYNGT